MRSVGTAGLAVAALVPGLGIREEDTCLASRAVAAVDSVAAGPCPHCPARTWEARDHPEVPCDVAAEGAGTKLVMEYEVLALMTGVALATAAGMAVGPGCSSMPVLASPEILDDWVAAKHYHGHRVACPVALSRAYERHTKAGEGKPHVAAAGFLRRSWGIPGKDKATDLGADLDPDTCSMPVTSPAHLDGSTDTDVADSSLLAQARRAYSSLRVTYAATDWAPGMSVSGTALLQRTVPYCKQGTPSHVRLAGGLEAVRGQGSEAEACSRAAMGCS
jgi:hypothetical protein